MAALLIISQKNLGIAMFVGALILGVFTIPESLPLTMLSYLIDPSTILLAIIVGLIPLIGGTLNETGQIDKLISNMRIGKKPFLMLSPALIGLLPMPGGALLSAPIVEKAGKLTVIDALNRTETLEMPIERVVITFNVEEYLAVGREESLRKVVGWSKYYWEGRRPTVWETYLERFPWIDDIPDVGYPWKGTFSAEKVMDCEPDVVIMCPSQYEQATEDVERLEKAGIPVIIVDFYEPFNIKAHAESTLLLGELLGERERARELISFYVSQVSEIFERLEEVEKTYPKPKVLLLGKEWTTYGKYHYRGEMIERAGGINIAADVLEQSGEIDPEYVLKANPDVIIFIGKLGWNVDLGYGVEKERAEEMLAEQIQRPGWEELNATKNNRVHAIHIYFVHGHIYDYVALQYFVKWFYPDAFTDINPEEAWKEFHERFLPVEYSGTWAVSL